MKYYELYVECYTLDKAKYTIKEVTVVKETPKQLHLNGTTVFIQRFNKTDVLKVIERSYSKYVIFPEGKEAEARKLMAEMIERDVAYHDKKLKAYKQLLKEVSKNG